MTESSHHRQVNLSDRPVEISETLTFMPYDGQPAEIGEPDLSAGGVASMVEIRPATLRDVTWIATYMRDQDRREINAVMEASDTAIGYSMFSQSRGLCWVAWLKGQPVCAFGVVRLYPGMGSCWAFGTRKMRRVIPAVTRFGLRTLRRKVLVERFRRLEVRTSVDHDLSHAWLERLGFEREGIARDYGRDGLDFVTYAVTRASDGRRLQRNTRT